MIGEIVTALICVPVGFLMGAVWATIPRDKKEDAE